MVRVIVMLMSATAKVRSCQLTMARAGALIMLMSATAKAAASILVKRYQGRTHGALTI